MYKLPNLPYKYDALEPHISSKQLQIHYQKHHQAYVDGSNKILEENFDPKKFAFQVGGNKLHSLFWQNLSPKAEKKPADQLLSTIEKDFESFDNFKEKFSALAMSVEGAGWATLVYDKEINKLILMQIEKHNVNIYPTLETLLVLDMFEHAYYIDYKNDKGKYIEAFWNIVNWKKVEKRFSSLV